MDHVERFFATIERRPVDRPAAWLGMPTPEAFRRLCEHLGVKNRLDLMDRLDDDIAPVQMPYRSPASDAVTTALDFGRRGKVANDERTLTAPGFFADKTDPASVGEFDWPDPTRHIPAEECRRVVAEAPPGRAVLGVIWSAHFQDACSAFGMENSLMAMVERPDLYRAVIDRIVEFYLAANGVFYEATRGGLHAVLIGNDFGTQAGLMVSPDALREFVMPGVRRLIGQAKDYGLRVIHHSCGSVYGIIGDLIDAGADVIHPMQPLARDMAPERLRADFGDRVAFCGGVDVQRLMVHGAPSEVRESVLELRRLFPTGLVISPSHEALLPDVPPENVVAMFEAACEAV